ncbi:MAG: hypothetical protein EPN56_08375 [Rhodanobacter sp.]|nr:MAG: hypothetical protein EPN78_07485 [Rhodanobacter sp.]TAM13652.1 MAG: hypothetical protein EPN66_05210 [Rhodanobacter sp.]TAM35594.1 MAG: hypothetical protein EPN56_08375 [Rhodanobacter sp.]
MTALYLIFSMLAALGFYLASAHQQLWPVAMVQGRRLRIVAWALAALATAAAIAALGPWAGAFAALTTIMLALVLLPHLGAWRQLQQERRHVG